MYVRKHQDRVDWRRKTGELFLLAMRGEPPTWASGLQQLSLVELS